MIFFVGNSSDKLRHPMSVAYSAEQVLRNKQQICGGGACLNCYLFVIILCHILRLKCIKFDFDWGFTPADPAGGTYICSVPPDHLYLSGSNSKGREGKERERRGEERV